MKKTLLAAAVMISGAAMAQNTIGTIGEEKKLSPITNVKTPTDTITDFFLGSPALVGDQDGGYLFGVNSVKDIVTHQVQGYIVEDAYNVEGAMIWVGAKLDSVWSMDSTSSFEVSLFDLNPDHEASAPFLPPLQSVNVPFYTVTEGLNLSDSTALFVEFNSPQWMTKDYGIGMNFQPLNSTDTVITTDTTGNADTTIVHGDTLGIVTESNGDGQGLCYNWLYVPGNRWFTYCEGWTFDANVAIFPIIEYNARIEEANFIHGLKTELYPNPVAEQATFRFELNENAESVVLTVYSMNGQQLINRNLGTKTAGTIHTEMVDVSNMAPGTYVYSVSANGQRITKKFVVK